MLKTKRRRFEMKKQDLIKVASVIFGIIAVLHAFRLFNRWDANIAGWSVPLWLSGVAVIVAGYLAYRLWKK